MRVLIIPEDYRKDQYILKPIVSRLLKSIGASRIRVEVCRDHLMGGVGEALKPERLIEVVEQHRGMADIFILCVDRDGVIGRRQRLDQIEGEFSGGPAFFAENAWEEIETWALAGLDLPGQWRWEEVRAEVQVKERYFEYLANRRGLSESPDGGRKVLGEEASRRVNAIRQKCPQDFDSLARRLEAIV